MSAVRVVVIPSSLGWERSTPDLVSGVNVIPNQKWVGFRVVGTSKRGCELISMILKMIAREVLICLISELLQPEKEYPSSGEREDKKKRTMMVSTSPVATHDGRLRSISTFPIRPCVGSSSPVVCWRSRSEGSIVFTEEILLVTSATFASKLTSSQGRIRLILFR